MGFIECSKDIERTDFAPMCKIRRFGGAMPKRYHSVFKSNDGKENHRGDPSMNEKKEKWEKPALTEMNILETQTGPDGGSDLIEDILGS